MFSFNLHKCYPIILVNHSFNPRFIQSRDPVSDPEFVLDPDLIRNRCHDVQLHYTFFDTDAEHSRFQQLSKDISAFFKGLCALLFENLPWTF